MTTVSKIIGGGVVDTVTTDTQFSTAFNNVGNCYVDKSRVCVRILSVDYDWFVQSHHFAATIPNAAQRAEFRITAPSAANRKFSYVFNLTIDTYRKVAKQCGVKLLGMEDGHVTFAVSKIYEPQCVGLLQCGCCTFLCEVNALNEFDDVHSAIWKMKVPVSTPGDGSGGLSGEDHHDCFNALLDRIIEVKPYIGFHEEEVRTYIDSCVIKGNLKDLGRVMAHAVEKSYAKDDTLLRYIGAVCQSAAKHRGASEWWISRFSFAPSINMDGISSLNRAFIAWRYCANDQIAFRTYEMPRKPWDYTYAGGLIRINAGTYKSTVSSAAARTFVPKEISEDDNTMYYAVHIDVASMYPNMVLQFNLGAPLLPWIMKMCLFARAGVKEHPNLQSHVKLAACKVVGYMGTSNDCGTSSPLSWCVSKSVAASVTRHGRLFMEAMVGLITSNLAHLVKPPVCILTDSMVLVAANDKGLSYSTWNREVIDVINNKFVPTSVCVIATNTGGGGNKIGAASAMAANAAIYSKVSFPRFISFRAVEWFPDGVIIQPNGLAKCLEEDA